MGLCAVATLATESTGAVGAPVETERGAVGGTTSTVLAAAAAAAAAAASAAAAALFFSALRWRLDFWTTENPLESLISLLALLSLSLSLLALTQKMHALQVNSERTVSCSGLPILS